MDATEAIFRRRVEGAGSPGSPNPRRLYIERLAAEHRRREIEAAAKAALEPSPEEQRAREARGQAGRFVFARDSTGEFVHCVEIEGEGGSWKIGPDGCSCGEAAPCLHELVLESGEARVVPFVVHPEGLAPQGLSPAKEPAGKASGWWNRLLGKVKRS